jgi:2,4-dienoyl-CoA reductase-like NADH-dependent reductase (Old Yellow Enzyme family)/NADPH-dependent 2,4-dienoyl-CoA reductase/sulfur reductase-like enzyme
MQNVFKLMTQPIQVGSLQLKHRMVMAPMRTAFCTLDGEVTQEMIDYYAARAKGGAALIIVECTAVDGRYVRPQQELRIDDIGFIAGLRRLVESVQRMGVPIFIQLNNGGPYAVDAISPSGVPAITRTGKFVVPRVMSLKDIEEGREAFIAAAVRARHIGFDGVLIHAATGYLLHQFLSQAKNKRTDAYGGSPENRLRLLREIVRGIRERCGADFPLGCAICADEYLPDGIRVEDGKWYAGALEKEGVDYLDISVGAYETFATSENNRTTKYQRTGEWDYTEQFKKIVRIPIFHRNSGDHDPVHWEKCLEQGQADVVQVGRAIIADPELFRKVLEGRVEDICPCTNCCYCFETGILKDRQVSCAMNPEVGRERDYAIRPALKPKKVLVVGGGPGGLEAARVAALQGHSVTLMERAAELGGKVKISSLCIANERDKNFCDWQTLQCRKAGVNFELNKVVTLEVVRGFGADAVILATGASKPIVPAIPGLSGARVIAPEDALTGKTSIGKKTLVIGGNRIGVQIAYTIAAKRLAESVTIVEPLPVSTLGYDMEMVNMLLLVMVLLPKYGVQGFTNTQIKEITDHSVIAVDGNGKRQKIEADSVIVAMGYSPDSTLYKELRGYVRELYAVGDCVKAREVADAVHEAACIARQL